MEYEVCAKCGHVGRHHYVEKIFVVEAPSGKEAAAKVRKFPRVKHDHKDAIRYVSKIDKVRFMEIIDMNANDPYFRCRNIQEQRKCCQKLVVHAERIQNKNKEYIFQKKPRQQIKRMSSIILIKNYYDELSWVS